MATTFWPSMRSEFIELARYRPASRVTCCTSFMHPSKSVSNDSTRAPLATGCTSCDRDTLSLGRNTTEGMPAAAQYAESAADVSPVDAHATARMGTPRARMCLTADTSTVMPQSLKLPVGDTPHSFKSRLASPSSAPMRGSGLSGTLPSPSETMSSTGSCG